MVAPSARVVNVEVAEMVEFCLDIFLRQNQKDFIVVCRWNVTKVRGGCYVLHLAEVAIRELHTIFMKSK